jgi:hypothetical protein
MSRRKPIKFEEGSGNIFADLGLEDAGELYTRAQIGVYVFKILKGKKTETARNRGGSGDRAARRVAPDERAFQPLHNGQAARFFESSGPESEDRSEPPSQGRALPAGHLRFLRSEEIKTPTLFEPERVGHPAQLI